MADAVTPRKRRWIRRILAILVLGPAITIASLPSLLSTSPARIVLVGVANQYLAPARIEVGGLQLTWLGSLGLSDVVLHDPHGKRVVAIPQATLDRGLFDLLFNRKNLGNLTLEGLAVDVERRPDGTIDVTDILPKRGGPPRAEAVIKEPAVASSGLPDLDLTVKVIKGSLRVQAPELIEPLTADRLDLTAQMTAEPGPLKLELRMEKGTETEGSSLGIDGTYNLRAKAGTPADLSLNVLARRWPFGVSVAGVVSRGQLDGHFEVAQKSGRWDLRGDSRLAGLDVTGPTLSDDRLRLDLVTAIWDVNNQGAGTWMIRRLNLNSPVARLSGSGPILGPPGTLASVEGKVDLAALARQLPHALRIREGLTLDRGDAGVRVDLRTEPDAQSGELTAVLSDLVAHDAEKTVALRSPASLVARVTRRGTNLQLEQLSITSDFLQTSGAGDLDQGIKIAGSLDLGAVQAQLRDLVNFGGVEMAGRGQYTFDYRRAGTSFTGVWSSHFQGLDIKGLTSEPIRREALKLQATINGPCAASGIPLSLGEAKVGLSGGPIGASATVTTKDDTTALTLVASSPLTLSEQADGVARADVKFQGSWHAPALEIGDLRLSLRPANVPPEASPLSLAVRGGYDRSKGEVNLNPIPGTPSGAVGLTAEGLHVAGLGQSAGALKVDAGLAGDLAALDQVLAALWGGTRHELAGTWSGHISVQPMADGRLLLAGRIDSPDLSRAVAAGKGRQQEGPLALGIRGTYLTDGGRLALDELGVSSRYATLSARGQLADATGRKVADLQGTLTPNWQTLSTLIASAVEPGASLQGGSPRQFRIKGPLSGASLADVLKGLDAELGLDLAGAQAYGLKLGPTPIVVRCGGGRTIIDPIVTSLNNGKVDLRPEVALDDPRGLALRLLPGSVLQDVEINDEVSQKVLSFIAPILEEATQVHGRVSASFDRAEFPIGGDDGRTMTVNGNIVFNDVVFGAGPLGGELLSLVGKGPQTALRIHQPIQLAIANRRISQSGLEIPINQETKITIRGSVGFDETLALRADVPITNAMLGRDKVLQDLAAGTTIPVPIGGTLTHPKADRRALGAALKEVTRSIFKRGAEQEATELLKRLTRDRGNMRPRQ